MLILPKPARDEFALGFIGRLCHINLVSSFFEMMQSLRIYYEVPSEAGAYLNALALLSGKDLRDFVASHTVAPAMLLARGRLDAGRLGGKRCGRIGDERNPLKLARGKAYFCRECIEQQRHVHGFPFWNRVHQLPGIYWCPWHRVPLLSCSGLIMQRALPSAGAAVADQVTVSIENFGNPFLNQFNEIMMDFLARPGIHDKSSLAALLRGRAGELGLNSEGEAGAARYLSDLAFEVCPPWWLVDVFGGTEKVSGRFFRPIDDVLSAGPVGGRAYALAIALLFAPDEWPGLRCKSQQ